MFFLLLMFLLGFSVLITSWIINSKTLKCNLASFRNSNQVLAFLGASMVASSISFLICGGKSNINSEKSLLAYSIFNGILGLIMLVLGIIMRVSSKGDCYAKGETNFVWVLGLIVMIGAGIHGYIISETGGMVG